MSAIKRTFSDPLEPIIYWDTSFALAALVTSEQWHAECHAFRLRLEPIPKFVCRQARNGVECRWDATPLRCVADYEHFGDRLLANTGTLSVVSEFVYDEVAFVRLRDLLAAESIVRGIGWQTLRRADHTFYQSLMPRVNALWSDLRASTVDLSLPPAVRARAFQLMNDFHLLPTDAYHIAAGLEAGVTAFVSLDADFLNVDGVIVYTCLP